jgi:hypothetical protein
VNADCVAVVRLHDRSLALASALTLVERAGAIVDTLLCCCGKLRTGVRVLGCPRAVARLVLEPVGFREDDDFDNGQREYRLHSPDDYTLCECEIPF